MSDNYPVEKECDGINHNVKIDFVTFITRPDEVWRRVAVGNLDEVQTQVQQYKQDKSPDVDMFLEYCCDKCKEAVNGNGS